MQMQQKGTAERVLFCLRREERPMTISELLPEVMPIKTDLNYAVSTGKGERHCYAEACIQTHLLWLMEQGRAERLTERGKIKFMGKN